MRGEASLSGWSRLGYPNGHMGDYGLYIWSAYGAAILLLGGLALLSVVARRRTRRALETRGLDRKR